MEKLDLRLKDDSYKIFVNTKGYIGDVSEEFKELIHFLDTSEIKEYENELVNDLAVALVEARNDEKWRQEYMKFSELMNEKKEEGRAEGREEGRTEGREEEIFSSVQDKDYSAERGAEKLGISLEDFSLKFAEWRNRK